MSDISLESRAQRPKVVNNLKTLNPKQRASRRQIETLVSLPDLQLSCSLNSLKGGYIGDSLRFRV